MLVRDRRCAIRMAVALFALPGVALGAGADGHLTLRGEESSPRLRGLIAGYMADTPHSSAGELQLPAAMTFQRAAEGRRRPIARPSELRWLVLGTAVLMATDRTTIKWFDADLGHHPPGEKAGKELSNFGTGLALGAMIVAPALLDGKYGRKTTGLTAMAAVNATLLTEGIKFLAGRERPDESGGRLRFHGPGGGHESFPSGHAAASFAVAEVLGNRYPRYKLPLYLFATSIGWARMNAAKHFPSDVFVGAAIGIYTGRRALRHGGRLLGR